MLFLRVSIKPCIRTKQQTASLLVSLLSGADIGRKPATEAKQSEDEVRGTS